jgi:hypothetical protein
MNLKKNIDAYKLWDPSCEKSIHELSQHFGWTKGAAYVYKYFISELSEEDIILLEGCSSEIDLNVIAAVCIQNRRYQSPLFKNMDRIKNSESPFNEIEVIIGEIEEKDPLTNISKQFWVEVGNYLTSRHIDIYPFNKKSIGFIKSIGIYGYKDLSKKQKEWSQGLIKEDKERPEEDRFFINEHLIHNGLIEDCRTIEKYEKCF